MTNKTGWSPQPLALKIVSVLLALWILGSFFAISTRADQGLPFFGLTVSGLGASLIVLLLDVIGPALLLTAIWTRKKWGVNVAIIYIGIFILNSIVALITVRETLGLAPILGPTIVNAIFLWVVYTNKKYFKN